MTDRIWIKGRSAWHATTVADIDTAHNEDRMVAVTCDKLIDARDTATISIPRPETGCCGGCILRIEAVGAVFGPAAWGPVGWHKATGPIDVIHSRNPLLLS